MCNSLSVQGSTLLSHRRQLSYCLTALFSHCNMSKEKNRVFPQPLRLYASNAQQFKSSLGVAPLIEQLLRSSETAHS